MRDGPVDSVYFISAGVHRLTLRTSGGASCRRPRVAKLGLDVITWSWVGFAPLPRRRLPRSGLSEAACGDQRPLGGLSDAGEFDRGGVYVHGGRELGGDGGWRTCRSSEGRWACRLRLARPQRAGVGPRYRFLLERRERLRRGRDDPSAEAMTTREDHRVRRYGAIAARIHYVLKIVPTIDPIRPKFWEISLPPVGLEVPAACASTGRFLSRHRTNHRTTDSQAFYSGH